MLHEFVTANSNELILRCKRKMDKRRESAAIPAVVEHGVSAFLQQLVESLRKEEQIPSALAIVPAQSCATMEIDREAALHGAELLRTGYNIDQVVHYYGDVCQSVTELAIEMDTPISTNDFRILNLSLDTAIASAATSFGEEHRAVANDQAASLSQRMNSFSDEQRHLIDIAIQSYTALKTGNIDMNGATSTLLLHALEELHALSARVLPEIRQTPRNLLPPNRVQEQPVLGRHMCT
jgi:hypothetical protein